MRKKRERERDKNEKEWDTSCSRRNIAAAFPLSGSFTAIAVSSISDRSMPLGSGFVVA